MYIRLKEKGRKKSVKKGKRKRQGRPESQIDKGKYSKRRSESCKGVLTRESL